MTNHPSVLSPSHPNHKQLHHVNHHHSQISYHSSQSSHLNSSNSALALNKYTPTSTPTKNNSSHNLSSIRKAKKHNAESHNPTHFGSIASLWMLIDGIGLAIITAATILEGIEMWKGVFEANWGNNSGSLLLWLCGRTSQIVGLLFLIGHASSFQVFPEIEQFGMSLLTLGPILNLCCCLSFHIPNDIYFLYNRQWLCSESLELFGILVLDVSLIHMPELYVLTAEITGFLILCAAAGLHFEYHQSTVLSLQPFSSTSRILFQVLNQFPSVSFRWDMVHGSECFGLMILILVAYGQYRLKTSSSSSSSSHFPNEEETVGNLSAHSNQRHLPVRQMSFHL